MLWERSPAASRMASRVTLTIVLSFTILFAIQMFIVPLPTAAFGLGIVLSIEGGVAVRDKGNSRQLVTRLFGCVASIAVVGIAAGLEDRRFLSDLVFLTVIALASAGRVFGPRGFAIGMAKIRMTFAFNCSAYEYWMVASGKLHFIGHTKLMPWDHLAGVLAHQEAGGHTAKFDGTPYRPGETVGGIISAPDKESWQLIRREIVGI